MSSFKSSSQKSGNAKKRTGARDAPGCLEDQVQRNLCFAAAGPGCTTHSYFLRVEHKQLLCTPSSMGWGTLNTDVIFNETITDRMQTENFLEEHNLAQLEQICNLQSANLHSDLRVIPHVKALALTFAGARVSHRKGCAICFLYFLKHE